MFKQNLLFWSEEPEYTTKKHLLKIPEKTELSENKTINQQDQVMEWQGDEDNQQYSDPPGVVFGDMEQFVDLFFNVKCSKSGYGKYSQDENHLPGGGDAPAGFEFFDE